jgi:hypothetical protein
MGMYLLKKYKRQFYHSRPNPYSGKAVNNSNSNVQFTLKLPYHPPVVLRMVQLQLYHCTHMIALAVIIIWTPL